MKLDNQTLISCLIVSFIFFFIIMPQIDKQNIKENFYNLVK